VCPLEKPSPLSVSTTKPLPAELPKNIDRGDLHDEFGGGDSSWGIQRRMKVNIRVDQYHQLVLKPITSDSSSSPKASTNIFSRKCCLCMTDDHNPLWSQSLQDRSVGDRTFRPPLVVYVTVSYGRSLGRPVRNFPDEGHRHHLLPFGARAPLAEPGPAPGMQPGRRGTLDTSQSMDPHTTFGAPRKGSDDGNRIAI